MKNRETFLARLDEATRDLFDPAEIMDATTRLLGTYLEVDRCGYCVFEPDQDTFDILQNYARPGVRTITGRYSLSRFGAESVRLLQSNLPQLVEDIETDPSMADGRATYRSASIRAHASIPVHKGGRLVAAIGVHHETARQWKPEEVELVSIVANRCWESIERTRITRDLRVSERRLRMAQRAGRTGSFEWLIPENRIIWSPELEALYEMPEGSFAESLEGWKSHVVQEDAAQVLTGLRCCFAQKEPEYNAEFRALLPDGSVRWLRWQAQCSYGETGAAERMIGVNIDIDRHKKAEAALRQQWRTFDTIVSNTPDALYTFDLEGRFTYANRALLARLGMRLEHVRGKTGLELGYPADVYEYIMGQIRTVIRTKEAVTDSLPFELPSGEIRHYEYILVPVLAGDGRVEAVAGSTRDITERKRAEERDRQQQERLREGARLESLGVMAGGVAHDFNNLLTGILGNASLLQGSEREENIPIVEQILLAGQRAAELTHQMLVFSGKGAYNVKVFDLNAVVKETLALLRSSLLRSVAVQLDLGCDECLVEADRPQTQQVVMNLMINAAEAIGTKPGLVTISTSLESREVEEFSRNTQMPVLPGRYIALEVRDNGSGMTAETMRRIFDPFFTTKFTGRGLGLAATLGIIKGHGGDIQVTSVVGEGTAFRALFPAAQKRVEVTQQDGLQEQASAGAETILIVDDEKMILEFAGSALDREGFCVVTANNGLEAVDVVRSRPDVALVILDLMMPVMTGEQALPLIRELNPKLPVILSSGFNETEIEGRFASFGIAAVLPKPYTAKTVLAKVARVLQTRKQVGVA